MPVPDWLVPVYAAGVGTASLVWQSSLAFRRRSRIVVGVAREVNNADFAANQVKFIVTVQNPGAESITIHDAGVTAGAVTASLRITDRQRFDATGRRVITSLIEQWDGPLLPAEIPARGYQVWVIKHGVTDGLSRLVEWRGFASLYRAGKPERRITSKDAVTHTGQPLRGRDSMSTPRG